MSEPDQKGRKKKDCGNQRGHFLQLTWFHLPCPFPPSCSCGFLPLPFSLARSLAVCIFLLRSLLLEADSLASLLCSSFPICSFPCLFSFASSCHLSSLTHVPWCCLRKAHTPFLLLASFLYLVYRPHGAWNIARKRLSKPAFYGASITALAVVDA